MARYRATDINCLPIEDCEPFEAFECPTLPILHRISDSYLGKLYSSCAIFKGRRFLASELAPITFTSKSLNIRTTGKVIGLGNAFVYDGKYVTLSGHVLRGKWTLDLEVGLPLEILVDDPAFQDWVERSFTGDYAAFNTLVIGTDHDLIHSITSPDNRAIGSTMPPAPGPYFGLPVECFVPSIWESALGRLSSAALGRSSPARSTRGKSVELGGDSPTGSTRGKSVELGGDSPVRSTRSKSVELGGDSPARSARSARGNFEDSGGPTRGNSEGYSPARSTHLELDRSFPAGRTSAHLSSAASPARALSEELGSYSPLRDPSESGGYSVTGYTREPSVKQDISSPARPEYSSPSADNAFFSSPARPLGSPSPTRPHFSLSPIRPNLALSPVRHSPSPLRAPTMQRSISDSRPFGSMRDLISANDDETPSRNPAPAGWSGHNRVVSLPNFPTAESPVGSPRFVPPTRGTLDPEISALIENEYGLPPGAELLVPQVEVKEDSNTSMGGVSDTTAERLRNFVYVPTSPSFRGLSLRNFERDPSPMSVVRSTRSVNFATYEEYEARDTDSANGAREVEFRLAFNNAIAATRIACGRARRALTLSVVDDRIEELNRALANIIIEEFQVVRELREQLFHEREQASIPE